MNMTSKNGATEGLLTRNSNKEQSKSMHDKKHQDLRKSKESIPEEKPNEEQVVYEDQQADAATVEVGAEVESKDESVDKENYQSFLTYKMS